MAREHDRAGNRLGRRHRRARHRQPGAAQRGGAPGRRVPVVPRQPAPPVRFLSVRVQRKRGGGDICDTYGMGDPGRPVVRDLVPDGSAAHPVHPGPRAGRHRRHVEAGDGLPVDQGQDRGAPRLCRESSGGRGALGGPPDRARRLRRVALDPAPVPRRRRCRHGRPPDRPHGRRRRPRLVVVARTDPPVDQRWDRRGDRRGVRADLSGRRARARGAALSRDPDRARTMAHRARLPVRCADRHRARCAPEPAVDPHVDVERPRRRSADRRPRARTPRTRVVRHRLGRLRRSLHRALPPGARGHRAGSGLAPHLGDPCGGARHRLRSPRGGLRP